MSRLLDAHQRPDRVDETVDRAGGLTRPGREAAHREEGPVNQARPVDEMKYGTRAHRRDCSVSREGVGKRKRGASRAPLSLES